jgi:hypothetical protein
LIIWLLPVAAVVVLMLEVAAVAAAIEHLREHPVAVLLLKLFCHCFRKLLTL